MEHLLSLTQQTGAATQIGRYILEADMFPLPRFCVIFDSALNLGPSDQVLFDAMLPEVWVTSFQLGRSCEGEMDLLIIRFRTRLDKRKTKDV